MKPQRQQVPVTQTLLSKRIHQEEQFNSKLDRKQQKRYHSDLYKTPMRDLDKGALLYVMSQQETLQISPRKLEQQRLFDENKKLHSQLNDIDTVLNTYLEEPRHVLEHLQFIKDESMMLQNQHMYQLIEQNQLELDLKMSETDPPLQTLFPQQCTLGMQSIAEQIHNVSKQIMDHKLQLEQLNESEQAELMILQNEEFEVNRLLQEDNQFIFQLANEQSRNAQKNMQVQILHEQFHSVKRYTRNFCLISCKTKIDGNYERYVTRTKNMKNLHLDHNDKLRIEDTCLNPWWSASKGKQSKVQQISKILQQNNYKFDRVIQKESSRTSHAILWTELTYFLKGCLFPALELMHRQYSFNSKEFDLVYKAQSKSKGVQEFVSPLKRIQQQNDSTHCLNQINKLLFSPSKSRDHQCLVIFMLSDKERGLIQNCLQYIYEELKGFNNQMIQVEEISFQMESFQARESIDIIENIKVPKWNHDDVKIEPCQYPTFMSQFSLIKESIYINSQYDIKILVRVQNVITNHIYHRQLNIIALTPLLIENVEIFARQLKQAIKKEKGLRDQLGSKLDNLMRISDKSIIIVEIPEVIKLNGKENMKVTKVKTILDFSQNLMIRRKAV